MGAILLWITGKPCKLKYFLLEVKSIMHVRLVKHDFAIAILNIAFRLYLIVLIAVFNAFAADFFFFSPGLC